MSVQHLVFHVFCVVLHCSAQRVIAALQRGRNCEVWSSHLIGFLISLLQWPMKHGIKQEISWKRVGGKNVRNSLNGKNKYTYRMCKGKPQGNWISELQGSVRKNIKPDIAADSRLKCLSFTLRVYLKAKYKWYYCKQVNISRSMRHRKVVLHAQGTIGALSAVHSWYPQQRILKTVWNDYSQWACLKWSRGMLLSSWRAVWDFCPLPLCWLFPLACQVEHTPVDVMTFSEEAELQF